MLQMQQVTFTILNDTTFNNFCLKTLFDLVFGLFRETVAETGPNRRTICAARYVLAPALCDTANRVRRLLATE